MRRMLLKSQIHRATVTAADVDRQGSVTIDAQLMAAANILPYERVEIHNVTSGARWTVHAVAGAHGKGEIRVDGAAAHHVKPGDLVILVTYVELEEPEAYGWHPRLVFVDDANRLLVHGPEAAPGKA